MADLGTINTTRYLGPIKAAGSIAPFTGTVRAKRIGALGGLVRFAFWEGGSINVDMSGTLSGSLNLSVANRARASVVLYSTRTKEIVDIAKLDASGNFSFTGLTKTPGAYYIICLAPGSNEQGQIYDQLTAA